MTGKNKQDGADSGTGATNQAASDDRALNNRVYADGQDFRQTLQAATTPPNGDGSTLARFDNTNGTPQITDVARDGAENQVVSTVVKDRRVVREHMASGPDIVVAYDKDGTPHRFQDQKISKLPPDFSSIPEWRNQQFEKTATDLVRKYMAGDRMPHGGRDRFISFHDVADMMKDVARMDDLTELEKLKVWTNVRAELENVPFSDRDEQEKMIDSWKGSGDPWHAIIGFYDGYHGDHLANMSEADATKAILDHENGGEVKNMDTLHGWLWRGAKFVLGVNQGDINASEGQLKALRALRSEGTFDAYAKEWEKQFVRTDRDRWGFPVR